MSAKESVRVDADAVQAFSKAVDAAAQIFEQQTGIIVGTLKHERLVHYDSVVDGKATMSGRVTTFQMADIDGRVILAHFV